MSNKDIQKIRIGAILQLFGYLGVGLLLLIIEIEAIFDHLMNLPVNDGINIIPQPLLRAGIVIFVVSVVFYIIFHKGYVEQWEDLWDYWDIALYIILAINAIAMVVSMFAAFGLIILIVFPLQIGMWIGAYSNFISFTRLKQFDPSKLDLSEDYLKKAMLKTYPDSIKYLRRI